MLKLIILLLCTSVVQAQSLEVLLSRALTSKEDNCSVEKSSNVCATDLCGPASKTKSLHLTNEDFKTYTVEDKRLKDRRLKDIESKMKAYLEKHNDSIAKIKSLMKSDFEKIDFSKFDEFEYYKAEFDLFRMNIMLVINHKKPLKDRVTYQVRTRDGISDEEIKVLNSYAEDLRASYIKDTANQVRYGVLTRDETVKALKEIANIENVDQYDEEELKSLYVKHSPQKPLEILCQSPACRRVMKNNLEKKYSNLFRMAADNIESFKASDEVIKDRAMTCLANSIRREEMNQKAEMFQKEIPKVIETFISKGMSGFSSHSKDAFRSFLKEKVDFNIKYKKPLDLNDQLNLLKDKGDPQTKLRELTEISRDPFRYLEECSDPNPKIDQVRTLDNNLELTLSYFSCSTEGAGKQILAHELGHLLSYAISKGLLSPESKQHFLKERECISSRHQYYPGKVTYTYSHPKDHLHSDEDYADHMVAATYPSEALFSCSLLEQNSWDKTFNTDLKRSSKEHSNAFMRLIWEAGAKKKKLPKSCVELLENQNDYLLKTCLSSK